MRSPHPKCGAIPASLHPDIVLNFSVSGQICGQTTLLRDYRKEECPKKSVFTRVFGLWKNEKTGTACMLPNVARYQLRHTPKYLIKVFLQLSAALPVATTALSSQALLSRHSPSCCHSFFLAFSPTGRARKPFQPRYIMKSFGLILLMLINYIKNILKSQ